MVPGPRESSTDPDSDTGDELPTTPTPTRSLSYETSLELSVVDTPEPPLYQ